MQLLSSEWLKTKHTLIRWLIFFLPILMAFCIVSYFSYRNDISIELIYESFFTIYSSIIIPLKTGIFTGFYIYEEELAGNFIGLLNTKISRKKIYLVKYALSALSLTICNVLTTLLMCLGLKFVLPQEFHIELFIIASILSMLGTLPILAIHTWLSFYLGIGASVGAGIFGILIAVLMGTTNLGNNIWYFIPWTYPVKMSMFPLVYSYAKEELLNDIIIQFVLCVSLSIILCSVFLLLGIVWFEKWEGRKNAD